MKDFNGAISNYDQAIKIQPDFSEAKKNKATCKLALNFFREGWLLYEARWLDTLKNVRLKTSKPELLDFKNSNTKYILLGILIVIICIIPLIFRKLNSQFPCEKL